MLGFIVARNDTMLVRDLFYLPDGGTLKGHIYVNLFWVFVPGAVLLALGLVVFEWRNRREQLMGDSKPSETASKESKNQAG
jgi:hypothetical protein